MNDMIEKQWISCHLSLNNSILEYSFVMYPFYLMTGNDGRAEQVSFMEKEKKLFFKLNTKNINHKYHLNMAACLCKEGKSRFVFLSLENQEKVGNFIMTRVTEWAISLLERLNLLPGYWMVKNCWIIMRGYIDYWG